uniref:ISXO2-like transposase domain-containing protein n=1 Tax=Romanomermis culicivorax TaxID=13658 RepID=A0A915KWQ7_ROMCU
MVGKIVAFLAHRLIKKQVHYNMVLERDICSKALLNPLKFSNDVFIEQNESEVEIDESFFGKKAKNDKGTSKQTVLVFGIVERNDRRRVLRIVPTNSKDILMPIIQEHISTDVTIYDDGLASYTHLEKYGYKHEVVFHNKEFVTDQGVHTNTIEESDGGVAAAILATVSSRWNFVSGSNLPFFLFGSLIRLWLFGRSVDEASFGSPVKKQRSIMSSTMLIAIAGCCLFKCRLVSPRKQLLYEQ